MMDVIFGATLNPKPYRIPYITPLSEVASSDSSFLNSGEPNIDPEAWETTRCQPAKLDDMGCENLEEAQQSSEGTSCSKQEWRRQLKLLQWVI